MELDEDMQDMAHCEQVSSMVVLGHYLPLHAFPQHTFTYTFFFDQITHEDETASPQRRQRDFLLCHRGTSSNACAQATQHQQRNAEVPTPKI
jgi:hypothetical protein